MELCPICNKKNKCEMKSKGQSCWCFNQSFPKNIFTLIPENKRGLACVCEQCVLFFTKKGNL
ncbi:cysteine-rich CWC family protein [Halalkalibacter akibai]|uniref:cysteine-rich CWC family protein n=1 Tax=Halalkalibacter akibai TaxID=1411 RepID=UPI0005548D55|nr:cysteine-rich CWC family protein [Halalkalibacter akibai]